MAKSTKNSLNKEQSLKLLNQLKVRFEQNPKRHPNIDWDVVAIKLLAAPAKMWNLNEMEQSGGEPDVIGYDATNKEYIFADCSAESPTGRRSICYDREGLESRKENRPEHTAVDMAAEMGIALMTENEYRDLQKLGNFDTKTSSWLQTPANIRQLGGAIFGDYRYGTVFIYHNGAQSYYSVRAFRGVLRV
jgi:hypothetical protein